MAQKATGFVGFPDGKLKTTRVPELFFSDILPLVDDLAELKLTLHVFWLLSGQDGEMRYLRGDDLRADTVLLKSLNLDSELRTPLAALADALERTVARNTLIRIEVEVKSLSGVPTWEDWYFLNTANGRRAAAMIRTGRLNDLHAVLPDEARLKVERPNIFLLYEQNFGMLTPLIADQLRDLEKGYPPDWISEAFDIAVAANKRALRYVQAILRRWENEGKDSGEIPQRDTARQPDRGAADDQFTDVHLG
jgi:DNA replication protein